MIRRAAIAALALAGCTPATAQMLCQERAEVLEKLAAGYSEAPIAMGLASNGALIAVLTSAMPDADEGDTWTIIVTQPNGISCVMATGENWQLIERLAMTRDPAS